MADEKLTKIYADWRAAEARYAEVLARFGDSLPSKVKKESALELAKVRDTADRARDKFFKKALK